MRKSTRRSKSSLKVETDEEQDEGVAIVENLPKLTEVESVEVRDYWKAKDSFYSVCFSYAVAVSYWFYWLLFVICYNIILSRLLLFCSNSD